MTNHRADMKETTEATEGRKGDGRREKRDER